MKLDSREYARDSILVKDKPIRQYKGRPKLKFIIPHLTLCFYCKDELANTWDHIIPYSLGGEDIRENLVPSCQKCNSLAGAMLFSTLEDKKTYINDKRLTSREKHRDKHFFKQATPRASRDARKVAPTKELVVKPPKTFIKWTRSKLPSERHALKPGGLPANQFEELVPFHQSNVLNAVRLHLREVAQKQRACKRGTPYATL